jgi:hypothetical protein
MQKGLILAAVLAGAGISLAISSHDTEAASLPTVSSPVAMPALTVETGWRRNWRRYGPPVVIPDAAADVDAAADGEVGAEVSEQVTVPGETPPVIAIVPVRPASCGQYRYWDGARCVDARYHDPYLGPR